MVPCPDRQPSRRFWGADPHHPTICLPRGSSPRSVTRPIWSDHAIDMRLSSSGTSKWLVDTLWNCNPQVLLPPFWCVTVRHGRPGVVGIRAVELLADGHPCPHAPDGRDSRSTGQGMPRHCDHRNRARNLASTAQRRAVTRPDRGDDQPAAATSDGRTVRAPVS